MRRQSEHSIPFEVLEGSAINNRFPEVFPLPGDVAVRETNAGYLFPEECIRAQLARASHAGAELKFEERVLDLVGPKRPRRCEDEQQHLQRGTPGDYGGAVGKPCARRDCSAARHAAGDGMDCCQQPAWSRFCRIGFRCFSREDAQGGAHGYGFPAIDGTEGGMKVAIHGSADVCTPESVDREIHELDLRRIVEQLRVRIPASARVQ